MNRETSKIPLELLDLIQELFQELIKELDSIQKLLREANNNDGRSRWKLDVLFLNDKSIKHLFPIHILVPAFRRKVYDLVTRNLWPHIREKAN